MADHSTFPADFTDVWSKTNIPQDTSIVNPYSMQNGEDYSETRTLSDVREDIAALGGDVSKAAAILRTVRGEGTAADAAAIKDDAVAERLVREYSDTEGDLVLDKLPESAREGYRAMLADFDDKSAASAAFEEAFRRGYNGEELTTHEGLAALERVAYEYGQDAKKDVGTVTLPRGVTLSKEAYKKLSEMAKKLGTHIVVTEHARQNKNGTTRGTYKTIRGTSYSEIVVAYDAKIRGRNGEVISGERAAVIQVIGHEVTHRLKDASPTQYARLVKFVESASESGDFARYMKRNRNNRAAALDEMTADFVMNNLFIDEKTINRLTKTDGKLAQTVRHVLQWLKEKLGMADKDLDRAIDLWNQAYRAAETENIEGDGVRYSREDIKDVPEIVSFVKNSLGKNNISDSVQPREIGSISPVENRAINKFVDVYGDGCRGKYTGGKHIIDAEHIRHAKNSHSDIMLEALRAQLPITEDDIVATLSAVANGQAKIVAPTQSADGDKSILQEIKVNGYTLYAEEIVRGGRDKTSNLEGRTIYKTPTRTTAQWRGTSPRALPKGPDGAFTNSIHKNVVLSTGNLLLNGNGENQVLYVASKDNSPVVARSLGGLIFLSADKRNIDSRFTIEAVNIKTKKPFYITTDNTVYKASNENVVQKVNDLKSKGYDCFIFDYNEGDRYAVMVTNKAQIVKRTKSK